VDPVANKAYVINNTSPGLVTVIDGATKATSQIAVGGIPSSVAVNPVTGTVYVASLSDSTVTEIDGATGAATLVQASVSPGQSGLSFIALAVDTATNEVYIASVNNSNGNEGSVTVLDGFTNAVTEVAEGINPSTLGVNSEILAVDPVRDEVYVDNSVGGTIVEINGITGAAVAVGAGSDPGPIAVNPVTGSVYAGDTLGAEVTVIDGRTGILSVVSIPAIAGAIAVNPASNKVYVVSPFSDTVAIIDGSTNRVSGVTASGNLGALAVDPVANRVYVLNTAYQGSVLAIDGTTNEVTSIPVGSYPYALAVNTATGEVYVLNQGPGGNVTVVDPWAAAPAVTGGPASLTVATGSSAVFNVSASGSPAPSYQWSLNGSPLSDGAGILGSGTPTLYLSAGWAAPGSYACTVTNAAGTATSEPATLAVTDSQDPGRLVNLSARSFAGTGSGTLIAGFVLGGSGTMDVLLRGIGPSLSGFGVADPILHPSIELFNGQFPPIPVLIQGAWGPQSGGQPVPQQVPVAVATPSVFAELGAFALPAGSADAACVATLPPGAYSSEVTDTGGRVGVALAEIYDADPGPSASLLLNLSERAWVGTGGNILIAGFVIGGSTDQTVLIRASGPALSAFKISTPLPDPSLKVLAADNTLVASNEGWGGSPSVALAASRVGAFAWPDATSADAAVLVTLPPGAYTATCEGAGADTGVGLVEVYAVP
jgi:DNA-binding beta-propeller fold protein YncE